MRVSREKRRGKSLAKKRQVSFWADKHFPSLLLFVLKAKQRHEMNSSDVFVPCQERGLFLVKYNFWAISLLKLLCDVRTFFLIIWERRRRIAGPHILSSRLCPAVPSCLHVRMYIRGGGSAAGDYTERKNGRRRRCICFHSLPSPPSPMPSPLHAWKNTPSSPLFCPPT